MQKSTPTVSRVVKEYEDENEKKILNGKWETCPNTVPKVPQFEFAEPRAGALRPQ